jgi:N-glycosylase/DNA lyase
MLTATKWCFLAPTTALRLAVSLHNGQTFQWRQHTTAGEVLFTGVVGVGAQSKVVSLREVGDEVQFAEWRSPGDGDDGGGGVGRRAAASRGRAPRAAPGGTLALLADYFQLSAPMDALRAQWSSADPRMAAICGALPGLRVLRQPPFECLVSFICSSNNNIARISGMLERLRAAFGAPLGAVPGAGAPFFAFPTPEALAGAPEDALRGLGMGYRAAFLRGTAAALLAGGGGGGEGALLALRGGGRAAAREALVALPGVGPKVADCVALFSCDQADCVPVDTHVWTIAVREMDASLAAAKSLTPAVYERVGDLFRARYVSHAGWAHSVLFTAELPAFQGRLPAPMVAAMAQWREGERMEKAAKHAAAKERKRKREGSGSGVE